MTANKEIKDVWRRITASKGEKLKLISDHGNVLIVENEKGEKISVKKEDVNDNR